MAAFVTLLVSLFSPSVNVNSDGGPCPVERSPGELDLFPFRTRHF